MSFRENLSKIWSNIQYFLIPDLEMRLGQFSPLHKKLSTVLELVRVEEYISSTRFNLGRPANDRAAIARSFIAKVVFKFTYTKQLVEYLKIDEQLRAICGWRSPNDIPSESKFSRVFKEFANSSLPERTHQALIKGLYQDEIVSHVVKDSTPLEVREKALNKGSAKDRKRVQEREKDRRRRSGEFNTRQKQLKEENLNKMLEDLPKFCDRGMKRSSLGYTMLWKGYKLHTAVDDHCVPLAVLVTSASLNDCDVAIPLAVKSSQVARNFYDLMDAAYDHPEIREHSILQGHVPIIDRCPHTEVQKTEKKAESKRKRLLKFQTAEDRRYGERMAKERFNALYKDYHGGRYILYRGHSKVTCHVMFGILVVAAATLIKLIQ